MKMQNSVWEMMMYDADCRQSGEAFNPGMGLAENAQERRELADRLGEMPPEMVDLGNRMVAFLGWHSPACAVSAATQHPDGHDGIEAVLAALAGAVIIKFCRAGMDVVALAQEAVEVCG